MKWCLAAIIVAIGVMFVADFLEGPFFSFTTKTWPPEVRGERLIGGIEGPLKAADSEAGTVQVASGFLGLASQPVSITTDTQIAVKGKLGGIADLDRGQQVRIAYQVLPDRLLALRVDVLDGYPQPSDAPIPAETESTATAPATPNEGAPKPVAVPVKEPARALAPSVPPAPARPLAPAGSTATPAPKRAVPSPSSLPRNAAQDLRRAAPAPAPPPAKAPVPATAALDDAL